ncbi:hypothetical protein GJ496_011035 [Pomphorhynchus laevis]|nr:hypothetical protein GJ496_011035 [Pomphorhynchus laevis]
MHKIIQLFRKDSLKSVDIAKNEKQTPVALCKLQIITNGDHTENIRTHVMDSLQNSPIIDKHFDLNCKLDQRHIFSSKLSKELYDAADSSSGNDSGIATDNAAICCSNEINSSSNTNLKPAVYPKTCSRHVQTDYKMFCKTYWDRYRLDYLGLCREIRWSILCLLGRQDLARRNNGSRRRRRYNAQRKHAFPFSKLDNEKCIYQYY